MDKSMQSIHGVYSCRFIEIFVQTVHSTQQLAHQFATTSPYTGFVALLTSDSAWRFLPFCSYMYVCVSARICVQMLCICVWIRVLAYHRIEPNLRFVFMKNWIALVDGKKYCDSEPYLTSQRLLDVHTTQWSRKVCDCKKLSLYRVITWHIDKYSCTPSYIFVSLCPVLWMCISECADWNTTPDFGDSV